MASSSSSGVVRRKLRPFLRYEPYSSGRWLVEKEEMKNEVIRLGIRLSVDVAQSMFLLCDDTRTMLLFCFELWRDTKNSTNPVMERLLLVMDHVYTKDIKPKNKVFQSSELFKATYMDLSKGIKDLRGLFDYLKRSHYPCDCQLLWSSIAKCKQLLKQLEDKLMSAEDVSKANGFVKETIAPYIFNLWKSVFDEETATAKNMIIPNLVRHLLNESLLKREDFRMQEEVVRLGVELSLHVAETMFLLCDDIRSMLQFCLRIWNDAVIGNSPLVLEKLLRVMHYVYAKDIKPKNGVYRNGCRSVQSILVWSTLKDFSDGIRDLSHLVFILRGGQGSNLDCGLVFTLISVEQVVKKIEDKLKCAKGVSEANGFAREAMESIFLDLWKSVFDEEAKEARQTLKVINIGIRNDLFLPILKELTPPPPP